MTNQDFRVKNGLQVGVGGTVFTADIGGKVGINSTSPTATLDIQGTVKSSGTITAPTFAGTATTATNLSDAANITTGIIGADRLSGNYNINISGSVTGDTIAIGTATVSNNLNVGSGNTGVFATGGGNLRVSGITTLGITSTTNLTSQQLNVSGITSTNNLTSQQLNVSGITTLGVSTITNLTSQQLNVSGITTLGVSTITNLTSQQLNVSGISTLGTVKISSGIVTATSGVVTYYGDGSGLSNLNASNLSSGIVPSARLSGLYDISISGSVTGDTIAIGTATVSNNLNVGTGGTIITTTANGLVGIGTTNPTSKLSVNGNVNINGIVTATAFFGDGTNLRGLSDSYYTQYASSANVSNSALSIAGINTYVQLAAIKGTYASQANDYYGGSVALTPDGNTLVVGAWYDEISGSGNYGVVYVYDRNFGGGSDVYGQVGVLTGFYATQNNDSFGISVAVSADGNTVVVGASSDETGATANTGVVYVYDRTLENTFTQVGILTGSDSITGDEFGNTVAISPDGNRIIIDSYGNNKKIYNFTRTGNSFTEVEIYYGSGFNAQFSGDGKSFVTTDPSASTVYLYEIVNGLIYSFASYTDTSVGWGAAISADGKTIVSGYNNSVSIFDRIGNSLVRVGILTGPSTSGYGESISISADGKTIAVGAYQDSPFIDLTGKVYIYNRQGNIFNQVGIVTAGSRANAGDQFGYSLAMSADAKTLIVGAPLDELSGSTGYGVVYIFDQTQQTYLYSGPTGNIGIGTTNPTSKLHVVGDIISSNLNVSGVTTTSRLNVGTGGTVITTTASGLVGIGTINPIGTLEVVGSVVADGFDIRNLPRTQLVSYASASDISNSALSIAGVSTYTLVGSFSTTYEFSYSGPAISADGGTIIVGDWSASLLGVEGAVYVYDRVGAGSSIVQVGILTNGISVGGGTVAAFGYSVATSADGKTIAVGALGDELSGTANYGLVYVFDRVGVGSASTFNRVGILTGSFATVAYEFGERLIVSGDGKTIIVGAPTDERSGTTGNGLVYVFDRIGNSFRQSNVLSGSLAVGIGDRFGESVATSYDGKTIIVGARDDEQTGSGSGSGVVYVFDRVGLGTSFNQVGILTGSLASDANDSFGSSVATSVDGKTIIVGAELDETGATLSTGVVYVFDRVGNTFNQVGIFTGSRSSALSRFGYSVATSADGKTIASYAPSDNFVYVHKREGNSFTQVGIVSYTGDSTEQQKISLTADGKTLILSNPAGIYVYDQVQSTYLYSGSTGNIGIGTSNPTSKLHVQGDVLFTGITTTSRLNVGTGGTVITTTASGLVGIGTILPTSKLHVQGDTYLDGSVTVTGSSYLDGTLDITGDVQSVGNINVSDTKTLSFIGGSSIFSNPHITIAALNTAGNLYELYAYDVTSGTDYVIEQIKTNTERQFLLANSGKFIVASDGTFPASNYNYAFKVDMDAETSLYHNQSEKLTTTGYGVTVTGGLSVSGVTTTGRLNVGTGGTVITTTAAGLVGIGTTNPTSKLHVIGDARVGIDTSQGVILTSSNGTKYRLIVSDVGVLSTVLVT